MTDTDMPEEVICFYMPGRCESMQVAVELYEKDWRQEPYRLKSSVDAERAEVEKEVANMKHDIERMTQTNADMATEIIESDKTIAALAEALAWYVDSHFMPSTAQKALSDNAPRIAEAQENQK